MLQSMLRGGFALGALVLVLGTGTARADETTFCNAYITTLPYTISTQGHYCFDRNLSTAQTTGNAITINSDFVVLDLNNFKLGGGSAGMGTLAHGIFAANRSNITIRNGNIRGFAFGIRLGSQGATSGQNFLIENNVLDGNTLAGILVHGSSYIVRNNVVSNTGGSTATNANHCLGGPQPFTTGIAIDDASCNFGGRGEITGNTVINTFKPTAGPAGISIFGVKAVVLQNRLMIQPEAVEVAVYGEVCRDNTALDIANASAYDCSQMVGTNSDF
jgi:parallel beta-helix repeat protein